MSDIDDESDNHDETNAFTCDDIDDDESDKSLTINVATAAETKATGC